MIFVLGAEGFVGSAICAFLDGTGMPYFGITRKNYDRFVGKSCEYFINAGGNSSKILAERDPVRDFELNVTSVLRILNDFKINMYLHLSTIDVYNDMTNPVKNKETAVIQPQQLSRYGFHKWVGELITRRYSERHVIFRLGGMFGKNSRKGPAHDIINGLPIWVSAKSKFLFLDTATVARYIWDLRDQAGEIFNLTASENLSLEEFAETVKKPIVEVRGDKELYYNINVSKAMARFKIPSSKDSVFAAFFPRPSGFQNTSNEKA